MRTIQNVTAIPFSIDMNSLSQIGGQYQAFSTVTCGDCFGTTLCVACWSRAENEGVLGNLQVFSSLANRKNDTNGADKSSPQTQARLLAMAASPNATLFLRLQFDTGDSVEDTASAKARVGGLGVSGSLCPPVRYS